MAKAKLGQTEVIEQPDYGISQHYFGAAGEKYFSTQRWVGELSARWNFPTWRPHFDCNNSILEFGCGGGNLLRMLPGSRKMGVEVNPIARKYGEQLGLEVYPTLDQVPHEGFTRVISSHALEHVLHPLSVLIGLNRFMVPGGQLIFLLPLDDWRARGHYKYSRSSTHHHLYSWTPQNLGNLFGEAGYNLLEIRIISDMMPPKLKICEFALKRGLLRRFLGRFTAVILMRRQLFVRATLSGSPAKNLL